MAEERIVFFGAGKIGRESLKKILSDEDVYHNHYLCFLDNDSNKKGHKINNLIIKEPQMLYNMKYDKIIITSVYENEVKNQLIKELQVSPDKILVVNDYLFQCFCRWVYEKKYAKMSGECLLGKKPKKIVVYTAIMGDYDDLRDPLFYNENVTYICFTNNKAITSNKWNIHYVKDDTLTNVIFARKLKILPHHYFKEFDVSIWIDGKLQIQDDLIKFLDKYCQKSPLLCFPHFSRECVYEEAAACIFSHKGKKEDIIRQIVNYYQQGFAFNSGLYETGVLIREHNNPIIAKAMENWWGEIMKFSARDQISFPFICWKNNILPDICDLFIYNNQWFRYYEHKRRE